MKEIMSEPPEVDKEAVEAINSSVSVGTFPMDGSAYIPFAGPGQYVTSRICSKCGTRWAILFEIDDGVTGVPGPPWHFEFMCRNCAAPDPMKA